MYNNVFGVTLLHILIDVQSKEIKTSFDWNPDSHTILYWKLESNANDYSGNSRNATYSNATYESAGSIQVSKFIKNQTNIYRDGTEISNIKGTAQFSYAFRFKLNSLPSSSSYTYYVGWVGKNGYNEYDKCVIFQSNGSLKCYNYTNAEHGFTSASGTVQTNKRYCIIYTYDGSTMKVYLNNTLLGQSSAPGSYPYSSTGGGRLILGKIYQSVQGFDGNISKFALQDIGWTETQAQNFFNKTKSKYGY